MKTNHTRLALLGLVSLAVLSACGEAPRDSAQPAAPAMSMAPGMNMGPGMNMTPNTAPLSGQAAPQVPLPRNNDPVQVEQGRQVFQQYCAECHGQQGQGAFNWRQLGADGKYPAPPLNGSGHAWHHPRAMLAYVIRNGSPGGQGNMPAWGDRLSEQDIAAVITWFQSLWPDEIYAAWYRNDQRAAGK